MAKLNMYEQESFKINMDIAKESNITFVHSEDKIITVAVMPHDRMGHYMRVFVAYCGNETPKRKRGINAVMNRYANDNYILVPKYFGLTNEDIAWQVVGIIEGNFYC